MSQQETLGKSSLASDYGKRLLHAITSLTAEVCQASSKDEVFALVAAWMPSIVPADRASVALPVDDDHLEVLALEGNGAIPIGLPLPIRDTSTGAAFRERRLVHIEDMSERGELDTRMLAGKGLVCCMNAPMLSQSQVIGTLNVAHWKANVYTSEHEALLLHVAGVVAAQLNLLDRFFATQGKLEAMVAERTQELETQKARLEVALDRERELSGLQRQFVSMVSHEFRTPLAIIDGSAQRIIRRMDKITTDRLLNGLGTIRTSVTRLTNLIESVLSAARIDSGGIEFKPEAVDIVGMVQEICASHQDLSPNHRIVAGLEKLPGDVHIDENLMRQVVSNLISNATRYTPEDTTVRIDGEEMADGRIRLSVRDEGPGIPEAELSKLFDRFYRGSTSTGIIGTGIGLHLVKVLVELHGGMVGVDSTEGVGTTFWVEFPSMTAADDGFAKTG